MAAEHNLMEYAPIGIMFLVAMGFAVSQLLVTQLIGPRKRTATKLMPYECGKDPIGGARDRFSIKFYTVALSSFCSISKSCSSSRLPLRSRATRRAEDKWHCIRDDRISRDPRFHGDLVVGYIYVWKKGTLIGDSRHVRGSRRSQADGKETSRSGFAADEDRCIDFGQGL
jgi:NADH:ubiquinone oxidoreductase subunit 3 (subunit A)